MLTQKSALGLVLAVGAIVALLMFAPQSPVTPGEIQEQDLIRIEAPTIGAVLEGPIVLRGQARGTYYFEASFPVTLKDAATGMVLAQVPVQASGEWMTQNYVPFEGKIEAPVGFAGDAILVFAKDNPSGLPEHDFSVEVPVRIVASTASSTTPLSRTPGAYDGCMISGCSAQICAEEEMASTCEYRESYACYKKGVCEKQTNGKCGWTASSEFNQCLADAE